MWHHFAFMAISLAMFGTTMGAAAVFLAPRFFEARRATFHMGISALLFAGATVGSSLLQTRLRFVPKISWNALDSLTFIYVIGMTDWVSTAFAVALLGAIASVCFLVRERRPRSLGLSCLACFGLGGFVLANSHARQQEPLIRLQWVKRKSEQLPLYEKWNSFSRITVTGDTTAQSYLHTWGLSPAYLAPGGSATRASQRRGRRFVFDRF